MINLRDSRGFNLSAGLRMISLCLTKALQRRTDPSDTNVIWRDVISPSHQPSSCGSVVYLCQKKRVKTDIKSN